MTGIIIVPDRLLRYISASVLELANAFSLVTSFAIIPYSRITNRHDRYDVVIAMGFPSRVFEGNSLYKISYQKLVLWMDDMGWNEDQRKSEIAAAINQSDLIITPNLTKFQLLWPQYMHKTKWLPLHATKEYLSCLYNLRPQLKCLLSGNTGTKYPIRHSLFVKSHQLKSVLDVLPHPGYSSPSDWISTEYANILNRYFCCVTDGHSSWLDFVGSSAQQYLKRSGFEDAARRTGQVVKKYFEIPAVGSLLLADNPADDEMKSLGFVPQVHYVQISPATAVTRISECLRNPARYELIRRQGMKLVHERHTIKNRITEFEQIWREFSSDVKSGWR